MNSASARQEHGPKQPVYKPVKAVPRTDTILSWTELTIGDNYKFFHVGTISADNPAARKEFGTHRVQFAGGKLLSKERDVLTFQGEGTVLDNQREEDNNPLMRRDPRSGVKAPIRVYGTFMIRYTTGTRIWR